MQEIRHIVLIGAGNVGSHLGKALQNQGFQILQVFSRTVAHARPLAESLQTDFTTDLNAIHPEADLYVLAVSDNAIANILEHPILTGKFLVHTSGAVPMNVLSSATKDYGVLYPLQTFSTDREVSFSSVPLCVEASSGKNLALLESFAGKISNTVRKIDSNQRKVLHLAAVFACNFSNFMYVQAKRLTDRAGLDFELLKPLILETAEKVQSMDPVRAQTGPARRGDESILQIHEAMLKNQPRLNNFYREISEEIRTMNINSDH